MRYITFPDDDTVFGCIDSTGHFSKLDIDLHPADGVQDCSYFLFENNTE